MLSAGAEPGSDSDSDATDSDDGGDDTFVELKEADAEPRRTVPPGRIVHLYQEYGVSKAALVDHTWAGFRRFNLMGHAVKDHSLYDVMDGLRSVQVRTSASVCAHACRRKSRGNC